MTYLRLPQIYICPRDVAIENSRVHHRIEIPDFFINGTIGAETLPSFGIALCAQKYLQNLAAVDSAFGGHFHPEIDPGLVEPTIPIQGILVQVQNIVLDSASFLIGIIARKRRNSLKPIGDF